MNLDDHTYELIDQYLQGTMPEDDPFVLRLKEDPELAEEVELRELMQVAVVDYRLMEVKKLLTSNKKEFIVQHSKKWYRFFWFLPIAVVGIATYAYLSHDHQKQSPHADKASPTTQTIVQEKQEVPIAPSIKSEAKQRPHSPKTAESIASKTETKASLEVDEAASVMVTESKTTANTIAEPKTQEAPEPTPHVAPTLPCSGISLKAFVEAERPCKGLAEGQLKIKETRGGKAPYLFSIDGKHFQEEGTFINLPEGVYDVIVKDANSCETIVYNHYTLLARSCITFAEHIFNPQVNVWEVPNDPDKQGELAIFNENGQRVYDHSFGKSEKINWSGHNKGGELLMPNVYIYSIKYADGVVEQGRITITY